MDFDKKIYMQDEGGASTDNPVEGGNDAGEGENTPSEGGEDQNA